MCITEDNYEVIASYFWSDLYLYVTLTHDWMLRSYLPQSCEDSKIKLFTLTY